MKILCQTPARRDAERTYVFDVLIGEWLGLDWAHETVDGHGVTLRILGQPGELRLPDTFFGATEGGWLDSKSLPKLPLVSWDASELGEDLPLIAQSLPVLFGDVNPTVFREQGAIGLPIDVFGSAFFMLTRYEEIVLPDRDLYDRFPSASSVAAKENFLERPIIDEYLEVLWAAMLQLWPALTRRLRSFTTTPSHDVDRPSRYAFSTPWAFTRRVAGDVIRRGRLASVLVAPRVRIGSSLRLHPADPNNTFNWLMNVSERHGINSAFYFICGRTNPAFDADYELEHPAIRDLLRNIHGRGHEIGLHPSFETYLSPEKVVLEAKRLRAVCADEGIVQEKWGGRMHFLRWQHPATLYAWEQAGMAYDSTLTYADRAGFRCGTCHEHASFDAVRAVTINTRTRPLVAMDTSVMESGYMNLGTGDAALKYIERLKTACRIVQGNFTLLWHNSELDSIAKRNLYEEIIGT